MLLLVILGYITKNYLWLFYWCLLVPILLMVISLVVIVGYYIGGY